MQISAELYDLIEEFVQHRVALELPAKVADPLETSREFAELARQRGIEAGVVEVRGYRGLAPIPGMDEAELAEVEHAVAVAEGIGLDFTFRQLDPNASLPTVYEPIEDLAIDWSYRRDDPDGEWQELPGPSEFRGE